MAKIPYENNVRWSTPTCKPITTTPVVLDIDAEIKLWGEKWAHTEGEKPGKGDDISFVLAFGNDGEIPCIASQTEPTVEDTMVINSPINLKLMSLCIGCEYELWVVEENGLEVDYEVKRCHVFQSGVYILQVRKKVAGGEATPYFDIPCHYIACIGMLFQVEFPACPECVSDCSSRQIENGCFENDLTGWKIIKPEGAAINAVEVFNGTANLYIKDYYSIDDGHFALLQTGQQSGYTSLSQTISVCAGDSIQGWGFFYTDLATDIPGTPETPQSFFSDMGRIEIVDANGEVIATLFSSSYDPEMTTYGITDWTEFKHTFAEQGTYVIRGVVTRSQYALFNSYLGMECIEIVRPTIIE